VSEISVVPKSDVPDCSYSRLTIIFSPCFVSCSLAYPVNGIIMGGLDWVFTMIAMWAANFVCVGMIRFWR
jgi:hypothetical protein